MMMLPVVESIPRISWERLSLYRGLNHQKSVSMFSSIIQPGLEEDIMTQCADSI